MSDTDNIGFAKLASNYFNASNGIKVNWDNATDSVKTWLFPETKHAANTLLKAFIKT